MAKYGRLLATRKGSERDVWHPGKWLGLSTMFSLLHCWTNKRFQDRVYYIYWRQDMKDLWSHPLTVLWHLLQKNKQWEDERTFVSHNLMFTVLVIFFCLFGFVIFQIVVWVCFQLMMLTKLTVMVAEIRQVRLRVQSLNRPQVAWELLTTSRLSPKLTQEYIVLISCVIYCFNVSSTSSK